jgi:hypothetical protein
MIVFLITTAEKLAHHDYYFLMPAAPLFVIVATVLVHTARLLPHRIRLLALCSLIASMAVPSFLNLTKALKEHADVSQCATLVSSHTPSHELLATYSDVARYNSITYYAARFAVRVEDTEFPIKRYRAAGATTLVVDLPPPQLAEFDSWLTPQNATNLISSVEGVDYKGQPRVCKLYRLLETH